MHGRLKVAVFFLCASGVGFVLGRLTSQSPESVPDLSGSGAVVATSATTTAPRTTNSRAEPLPDRESMIAEIRRLGAAPINAQRYDELRKLLAAWGKDDPLVALAYVTDHFPKDRQEQLVPELLGVWAKDNPRAAWDWVVRKAPPALTQPTLVDAVLSEIGKADANLAWRLAEGMAAKRPDDAQSTFVSALRGILYAGDYPTAIRLLGETKLPTAEGRYDLTSLIASDWGRYEPEKAAAWLMSLPAGFDRRQALISLSQSWSTVDARAAADFAAQLPPSDERQAMLATAVDNWVTGHPGEVGVWMLRYKQSPDFDQVVAAVASSEKVVSSSVKTSIEWAETITDYDVRLQTLARIMDRWMTLDSESTKKFLLSSNDLPAEIRDDLRKRLRLD